MKNTGREFELEVYDMIESLVAQYPGAKTTYDDRIDSFGRRQIDTTVRYEIAGAPLLPIIECKDHKTKLDNPELDAIIGKIGWRRRRQGDAG